MPSNKFKTKFPPARIKKIMQTDEEVGKVAAAVPVIVSKSLELFTEIFLQKCGNIAVNRGARTLSIDHIKECVDSEQKFDFLREIVAESAAKAVGKSGDGPINQSNQSNQPIDQSTNQPTDRTTNQSIGQSTNQSIDYSINQPSHKNSSQKIDFLSNETKEATRLTVKTELGALRQRKKSVFDSGKTEKMGDFLKTSPSGPPDSFPPRGNLPDSAVSVITKCESLPFSGKKELKREFEEEKIARRKKQSRLHSVVNGLSSTSASSLSVRDKDAERQQLPRSHVGSSKRSEAPLSVIVNRDTVQRSHSHVEGHSYHQSYSEPLSHGPAPASAPASAPPTSMQFLYAPNSIFGQPSGVGYASPVEAFPYSPQAMMMMMQHQQDAREALQYQLYAQHEQRRLEESRLPTYPCPRPSPCPRPLDFSPSSNQTQNRSVIVPTAEAQDLRINRQDPDVQHVQHVQQVQQVQQVQRVQQVQQVQQVQSTSVSNGHRFQTYHDRDGGPH